MKPDLRGDGPRGIFCPGCGQPVHRRMIAKSYPAPGGQFRLRYCPTLDCAGFREGVETLEAPVGFEPRLLDVSDLPKEDVRALRAMVAQMRKLQAMKPMLEAIEREHATRASA